MQKALDASDIITNLDGIALELLVGAYVEWRQHRDVIEKKVINIKPNRAGRQCIDPS